MIAFAPVADNATSPVEDTIIWIVQWLKLGIANISHIGLRLFCIGRPDSA